MKNMKLLLHACCAPCSIQCVQALADEDLRPTLFWYNHNIHPYTEYRSRLDALQNFSKDKDLSLVIEDEYGLQPFIKAVSVVDAEEGKRCIICYRMRLEKTAIFAAANGYDAFSTSLLISPYQNHELIKAIGEELAAAQGIEFLYRDFRSFFRISQKQAREAGYYMQKYCGCIFSEEERYCGQCCGACRQGSGK